MSFYENMPYIEVKNKVMSCMSFYENMPYIEVKNKVMSIYVIQMTH